MPNDIQSDFLEISNTLLKKNISNDKKREVCIKLYDWFCKNSMSLDYFNDNHTYLKSGQALSVQEAGECILDYKRTVTFISGIKSAIEDLILTSNKRSIKILYAGTGPFATLLLPVLHLFEDQDLKISLLDVHDESIQNVKHLVQKLGYGKHVIEYLTDDATSIAFSKNEQFDLIISETMNKALTQEPQVAIIKNLSQYLTKDGIFIPEEISIKAICGRYSNEPNLTQNRDTYILKNSKKPTTLISTELSDLFSISKSSKSKPNDIEFESEWLKLPKKFETTPDIILETIVTVYGGYKLMKAESLITNPYCIASIPNFPDKSFIQLIYSTGDSNNWTYKLK